MFFDHFSNIRSMCLIKSSINLIKNINRRRFILKQRQNKTQRQQRPLPSRKFTKSRFPAIIKSNFNLQTLRDIIILKHFNIGHGTWQKSSKYILKIVIYLFIALLERLGFKLVQGANLLGYCIPIADHSVPTFYQVSVLFFCLLGHLFDPGV